MELRINVSEKHLILILASISLISCVGLVLAYGTSDPDEMGHTWGEMYCSGCITSGNLADASVTNAKISSMNWGKLTNVPVGLDDGDNDTVISCAWTGWAGGGAGCLDCAYVGCAQSISTLQFYCSNGRVTQAGTTGCCVECNTFTY